MVVCNGCHCDPCLVLLHQEALVGELSISILDSSIRSRHKQNILYYSFVCTEYGVLNAGNCIYISECVVKFMPSICPSKDRTYTDHCSVEEGDKANDNEEEEEGNEHYNYCNAAIDTSYEDMEKEASPHLLSLILVRKCNCLFISTIISSVMIMFAILCWTDPWKVG
jgi:hypothetical protein